jgi:type II secretory pathway pseudopilin PulG
MRHAIVALFLALGCLGLSWRTGAGESGGGQSVGAVLRDEVRPEQLLGAASFLAARYDGADAHMLEIKQTADWRALEETQLMARVLDLVQMVATASSEQTGIVVRQLLDHIRRKGLTAAVALGGEDAGLPVLGVVLHEAGRYGSLVASLLRELPESTVGDVGEAELLAGRKAYVLRSPGGLELTWWDEGGHLAIGVGTGAWQWMLAARVGDIESLDRSPMWAGLRSAEGFETTSFGWFDVDSLVQRFGAQQLPPFASGTSLTVQQFLRQLGITGLRSVTMQTGFRGAATWSETRVNGSVDPGVLQRYLKPTVLKLDELPPLPQKVSGFSAAKLNLAGLMDASMAMGVRLQGVMGDDPLIGTDGAFNWLQSFVGGYTLRQFLGGLGDVWCEYNDPQPMVVPVGYSPVLAVSVRDQEAVAAGLYRLESLLQGVLAGAGGVTLERAQKGDRSYWTLKSEELPVAPTLMLTKSWLAIAVNPPALEGLVLREAGEQGRWVPDELVQGALSELPGEFGSISVSDPVPTYRQMFETLPMALLVLNSQVLPNLGEGLELPFGLEDMPAAESVLEPMFPNVSVGYATEGGYAWKTRQSVPGTPVGNLSAGAVGGVLVALLLPAVQQAREAARRTQSKNNLRTIGLALHNYHDVFGHFPRGTPEQPDRPVEERLSWAYELLPYLEEAVAYEGADREQGWAGQGNAELIGKKFDVFRNPSQPGQREYESAGDYVAIAGVGANAAELPDNDLKAGIFGYDRKTSFRSVTDGTSNTMMVADSSQPNVSMFAGGKPTVRGFSQQPYLNGPDGIGSPHPGIVHVLMADGSVRALAVETDPQIIEALATKAGGEVVGDF